MTAAHHALLLGLITILFLRIGRDSGDRFYIGMACFWAALFVIVATDAVASAMQ